MSQYISCPCCKKNDCFLCPLWNDDSYMEELFSENGYKVGLYLGKIMDRCIHTSILNG